MTAAIVWTVLILIGCGIYLAGDVNGRRAVWEKRRRDRRRIAERAYEEVTLLGLCDELADNERWSRKAPSLEVVR